MHPQSFVVDFSSVSCFTAIPFFGLSSGVFGHSCRGEGGLNRGPPSLMSRYRARQFVLLFHPCVVPFNKINYGNMFLNLRVWGTYIRVVLAFVYSLLCTWVVRVPAGVCERGVVCEDIYMYMFFLGFVGMS